MTIEENESDRAARQVESEGLFRPGAARLRAANARAAEEVRTTSSTGGQKGVKLARFDLIPVGPLLELAEHYGVGASKYADHQWRNGYEWSKSYSALMRHLAAFWAGFDFDVCSNDPGGCSHVDADGLPFVAVREDACFNHTGSHHLAAVAWHAFAMLDFKERFPEHDDRYVAGDSTPSIDDFVRVIEDQEAELRRLRAMVKVGAPAAMAAPEVDVTIVPVDYLEKRVAVGADLLGVIPISAWEAAKRSEDDYSWGEGVTISQEQLDELMAPYTADIGALLNESATRRSD